MLGLESERQQQQAENPARQRTEAKEVLSSVQFLHAEHRVDEVSSSRTEGLGFQLHSGIQSNHFSVGVKLRRICQVVGSLESQRVELNLGHVEDRESRLSGGDQKGNGQKVSEHGLKAWFG
jgi:hypothetical protein